ncbi:MAG: SpoIIE family protein phosphatase [Clostridia bacterium]|nr:SpoIIE family protein phosphatase [Clostridia bacterium]
MMNKTESQPCCVDSKGTAPDNIGLFGAVQMKFREILHTARRFFTAEGTLAEEMETEKESVSLREVLQRTALPVIIPIGKFCAFFVLAFLFAACSLGFGTKPAGLALLCAAGVAVPAVLAGNAAAVFLMGGEGILYGSAVFLAIGIRWVAGKYILSEQGTEIEKRYRAGWRNDDAAAGNAADTAVRFGRAVFPPGVFAQTITARVGISLIAACTVAAGILLGEGFSVENACRAVYFLCAVPLLTYLFCGVLGGEGVSVSPALREGGIGMLCCIFTASMGGAVVLGFSLKQIMAHLITLYISRKGGFLRGSVCGLLCGVACDGLYAPGYALIGAVSGVFWQVHPAPAVVLSLLAGGAYAVYIGAFAAVRSVVPEMIAASAAAYPVIRYLHLPDLFFGTGKKPKGNTVPSDAALSGELLGVPPLADQLDALSGILNGLSATFYHLSDRGQKPGLSEIRSMCETTAKEYCASCEHRKLCWEEDFSSTAEAMGRVTLCVHKKGRAEVSHAFAPLDTRCPHFPNMLAAVSENAAVLCEEKMGGDKLGVAAADYEGMAKLLRASAEENAHAAEEDKELSRRLTRAMARLGFRAGGVRVMGKRRRTVIAEDVDLGYSGGAVTAENTADGILHGSTLLGTEELRAAFSALAGVRYQAPDYRLADGGKNIIMTMHAAPQIALSVGFWGEKKPGEEVSGDALSVFANRSDYFYTLLCDGMGSGKEASVTAQIAALFLEKLLSVSTAKGAALNLLNSFLRARQGECSATVDLCEVDMITREAHFVKCGAAATFLVRGDHIFRIASGTMPLGILKEVSAEETSFTLEGGDLLLFFSDGVCGDYEDSAWILKSVQGAMNRSSREQIAAEESGGNTRDHLESREPRDGRTREERLLNRAAALLGEAAKAKLGRRDDMTVAVMRVTDAEICGTDVPA